jgi:hypothetical protein
LQFAPVVSSPSILFVLLCLATRLAPFRSRIATLLEKCLILAGKREFLSAVATGQLQILCHNFLSFTLSLYATTQGDSWRGGLGKATRAAYAGQEAIDNPISYDLRPSSTSSVPILARTCEIEMMTLVCEGESGFCSKRSIPGIEANYAIGTGVRGRTQNWEPLSSRYNNDAGNQEAARKLDTN